MGDGFVVNDIYEDVKLNLQCLERFLEYLGKKHNRYVLLTIFNYKMDYGEEYDAWISNEPNEYYEQFIKPYRERERVKAIKLGTYLVTLAAIAFVILN